MRFEAIEIERSANYNFIVGTKDKPDEALKERIREQIREAMEALGREPEGYSVTVMRDDWEDRPEEREYPTLFPGRNYLLFAMLSSGSSGESLSSGELEERKSELAKGVFCPANTKIALVLLQDSRIGVIVTKGVPTAQVTSYVGKRTPSRWRIG